MKKANRIFIVTGSILILLSTVVMANSASFSLGPDDTWTSSKTSNPWYYNIGVIDVGVTNFKGDTASMQFMEVKRFLQMLVGQTFIWIVIIAVITKEL